MTNPARQSANTPARLLRFLLPVLLLHVLVFASLPYWPSGLPSGRRGIAVELAPIATPSVQDDTRHSAVDNPVSGTPPSPAADSVPAEAPPPAAGATTSPGAVNITPEEVITSKTTAEPQTSPAPDASTAAAEPAPGPTADQATPAAPPPTGTVATNAGPSSQAGAPPAGVWQDDYRSALSSALARHHHYPARARRFGMSGTATVRFAILRDGQFEDIMLAHSSGADLLDQAALATVQRLGRFQPLPAGYSDDSWTVSVPLVYRRN